MKSKNTITHQNNNDDSALLSNSGWKKYKVVVRRNYYGEIQEEERIIEGETFERAKFYFDMSSLFWSVSPDCNECDCGV